MDADSRHSHGELLLALSFADGEYELVGLDYTQLQECIVPVIAWHGQRLHWLGTAFAVASTGLFLTARHVFEEFLRDHGQAATAGQAGLYTYWETDRPLPPTKDEPDVPATVGGPLPVVGVSWHPRADLGLLQVDVPVLDPPVTFPTLSLHVGLPRIGQQCVAVAYDKFVASGEVLPGVPAIVEGTRQLAGTRGVIEHVHPERRDSRLDWPCFLTDARFPGGMSGGPVVAADGLVVGAVCSGTELQPGSGLRETSYATLLAQALPLPLPPGGPPLSSKTLVELAGDGLVSVTGWEHVDVVDGPDGLKQVYVGDGDQ